MSRHPFLVELSRDHHHALVLGRRARRWSSGDAAELAAGWAAIRAAYDAELAPHFADEEARVLPVVAARAPALVARTLEDHRAIRAFVRGPDDAAALRALGELLDAHVRFEERALFPAIEAALAEPR